MYLPSMVNIVAHSLWLLCSDFTDDVLVIISDTNKNSYLGNYSSLLFSLSWMRILILLSYVCSINIKLQPVADQLSQSNGKVNI